MVLDWCGKPLIKVDPMRWWVPLAHAAFLKNRLRAATLSAPARAVARRMLAGEQMTQSASGLSPAIGAS